LLHFSVPLDSFFPTLFLISSSHSTTYAIAGLRKTRRKSELSTRMIRHMHSPVQLKCELQ